MRRAGTRNDRRNVAEEAAAILAGRAAPEARRLLELIHRVNPTGLDIPPDESAHRYALKGRLQSLLVRHHGDELRVSPCEHGIVALHHDPSGRDACHVKVVELDADARSWIQWQLDRAAQDDDATSVRAEHPGSAKRIAPASALDLGRQAMAAYDYPAAQEHLERAVEDSRGDAAAALALLTLLVDHMAQDEEALALERRLDPVVVAMQEVRVLLAVAAARGHDRPATLRLLRGLSCPRAADAWVLLALDAVAGDSVDDGERFLAAAHELDPAHPEVPRLRDELARRRAQARQPLEEDLERALTEGDVAGAEQRARAVLERWPDSVSARRALQRIEGQRRREQAAGLVEQAARALSDGRLSQAAESAGQAQALGAEVADLAARIARAQAAVQLRREDERVDELRRLLAGADLEAALRAYLMLEVPLRARVRETAAQPMLGWLEEAGASRGGRGAGSVRAVLALGRACEKLTANDPEEALRLVEQHAAALDRVAYARTLRAEAERRLAERRRAEAERDLESARAALAIGDVVAAHRLSEALDLRVLSAESRGAAQDLTARVRRRRLLAVHDARVDTLTSTGDLLGAVAELEAILAIAGDDATAAAYSTRREALRAALRDTWRVHQHPCDRQLDGGDAIVELLGTFPDDERPLTWLAPGGQELVLGAVHGRWVFVATLGLADRRMRQLLSLSAPEALGEISTHVDGDSLWFIGEEGNVLEICWRTGDVRSFRSLRAFLAPDETLERAVVLPGSRTLWMEIWKRGERGAAKLVDVANWRVFRELDKDVSLQPLLGGAEPRMAAMRWPAGAKLHTPRGAVLEDLGAYLDAQVSAVAVHPGMDGLVLLASRIDDAVAQHDLDGFPLELVELTPGVVRPRRQPLDGTDDEMRLALITARDHRLVFARLGMEGACELRAYSAASGGQLDEIYRAPCSSEPALVQDAEARRAFALVETARGIDLHELGSTPPSPPIARAGKPPERLPFLTAPFLCGHAAPETILGRAEEAARGGRWDEVRRLLEPGSAAIDDAPSPSAHAHHLLGLALFFAGDLEGARDAWARGRPCDDPEAMFSCHLADYLELVVPLPEPLTPAAWGPDQPMARQLRGAIHVADACFDGEDSEGARDALRRPAVFRARELQSLARLAEAYLRLEAMDAVAWWDKALALSQLVEMVDLSERQNRARQPANLSLARRTWDHERLRDVARRARAWLETSRPGADREAAVQERLRKAGFAVAERLELHGHPATMRPIPDGLEATVRAELARRHAHGLYRHQSGALEAFLDGRDVVLATATASGKSLVFMAAAMHVLRTDPQARVLAFYPARALIQDQVAKWAEMCQPLHIPVCVIDGGVLPSARARLLDESRVVLMTPDVAHAWLLRSTAAPAVRAFLDALALLVLDEAHVYEGVFGTNMAYLLRRLEAASRAFRVIVATATLDDPDRFVHELAGRKAVCLGPAEDGSQAHEKAILLVSEPKAHFDSAVELLSALATTGNERPFLAFVDSRRFVEQLVAAVRRSTDDRKVMPYRAGYEPQDRRRIQEALARGRLAGVVATSALELGLDIGDLDVVVLLSQPRSMKAFWQRVGRVGRRGPGVCLLLDDGWLPGAGGLATYARRPLEPARLYLENRYIQYVHALCGSAEGMEPASGTAAHLPPSFRHHLAQERARAPVPSDLQVLRDQAHGDPHLAFPIRTGGERSFDVSGPRGLALGSLSLAQVLREAYPGAIYYYMARPYRVVSFDYRRGTIRCRSESPHSTRPTVQSNLFPRWGGGCLRLLGNALGFIAETEVQVAERVTGFIEKRGATTKEETYGPGSRWSPRPMVRFVETTGVMWTFGSGSATSEGVARAVLETYAAGFGVAERDLGVGRFHARVSPLGPGPARGFGVYDATHGSLRLTETLAVHFGDVVQAALRRAQREDPTSAVAAELAAVMQMLDDIAPVTPGIEPDAPVPEDGQLVIAAGERAMVLASDGAREVVVAGHRLTPEGGLLYDLVADRPDTKWSVAPAAIQPLAGETRSFWVDRRAWKVCRGDTG